MKLDQAVDSLLTWETCGDTVARKAWNGSATANRGPKVKFFFSSDFGEHNVESLPLNVIGLNWSDELDAASSTSGLRPWTF